MELRPLYLEYLNANKKEEKEVVKPEKPIKPDLTKPTKKKRTYKKKPKISKITKQKEFEGDEDEKSPTTEEDVLSWLEPDEDGMITNMDDGDNSPKKGKKKKGSFRPTQSDGEDGE